jgi:hypothetical protein
MLPTKVAREYRCRIRVLVLLLLISFNQLFLIQISATQYVNPTKVRSTDPLTTDDECTAKMSLYFLDGLRRKYGHQPTFLQAVEEMAMALLPLFEDERNGAFNKRAFLAMTEPERTIRLVHLVRCNRT